MQHDDVDLVGTAAVVQAICELPAVPTIDWCDRAAWCLAALGSPSLALVLVTAYAGASVVTQAVGVAGRGVPDDGTVVGIRARCERADPASLLGCAPNAGPALAAVCGPREGWHGPLVIFLELGPPGVGRMLTAALTTAGNGKAVADRLAAVAPALHGRGRLALGGDDPPCWLTEREQVVLSGLVRGRSVKEIAESLHRSPHTVHDHVKTLHKKLHASTRGALVARALGHPEPLIPQTRQPRVPAFFAARDRSGPPGGGRA